MNSMGMYGAVSSRPNRNLGGIEPDQMLQAFAPAAIADLVVVLVEVDEVVRRKPVGGPAVPALAIAGVLPVVDISVLQRLMQVLQRAEVVVVAGLAFLRAVEHVNRA